MSTVNLYSTYLEIVMKTFPYRALVSGVPSPGDHGFSLPAIIVLLYLFYFPVGSTVRTGFSLLLKSVCSAKHHRLPFVHCHKLTEERSLQFLVSEDRYCWGLNAVAAHLELCI